MLEQGQVLEQKQENPRLKRIPLNLGNKFINLLEPSAQVQLADPLNAYPTLLILFGSEWCNITKPFISQLKKHYNEINLETKNVEVIYVSLDKSKKQFEGFTKDMPWLGISFDDQRVKSLKEFYNVRSIPYLVLVDHNGQIIDNDCRQDIYKLKEDDAFEKWRQLKQSAKIQSQQQIKQ